MLLLLSLSLLLLLFMRMSIIVLTTSCVLRWMHRLTPGARVDPEWPDLGLTPSVFPLVAKSPFRISYIVYPDWLTLQNSLHSRIAYATGWDHSTDRRFSQSTRNAPTHRLQSGSGTPDRFRQTGYSPVPEHQNRSRKAGYIQLVLLLLEY